VTKMRKLLPLVCLFAAPFLCQLLAFPALTYSQTCTTATCTAAGLSEAQVLAALPSNANANTTVTVNLPAGTGTWTAGQHLSYSIPPGITNLTIIGAGNQSVVGGGDATVLIDNTGTNSYINISVLNANQTLRVSGITFEANASSTVTANGMFALGGKGQIRVDHVHLWDNGISSGQCMAIVYGALTGVYDHDVVDMPAGSNVNGVRVVNGQLAFGDTSNNGNLSWSNPTSPGRSSGYLFFEDNIYNGGISNDCSNGGRQVFRHSTFNQSSIQTHEGVGDGRGCRATEAYQNSFNGVVGDSITSFSIIGCRMGTCLVWDNSITNYGNVITVPYDRLDGHILAAPPNGYGYCGTEGVNPGPSNWDATTTTIGYPCLDQPGRGQSDVLSGNFPNKCNITTFPGGCTNFNGSSAHNKMEPIYEWLNQYVVGGGGGWNHLVYNIGPGIPAQAVANSMQFNRDFYQYTLSWNGTAWTGTAFNGTVGTGSGLLSARPTTCTPGFGGTFGASPVGSFGVAYWGTDTNTLYICTATNTWTAYYVPYTYPHPLVTGSQSSGSPAPPTGLTASVN